MSQYLYQAAAGICLLIIAVLVYMLIGFEKNVECSSHDVEVLNTQRYQLSEGFQTSARYLSKLAKLDACIEADNQRKQQIHAIIKDLEIKASSYAFLNKVFFWFSLGFAICIIVFPIISSLTTEGTITHIIFNPGQLPAITLLAGLCFTFYIDYKGKQTSAENLIRYAYFSEHEIEKISQTVREGLSEIDGGQNFSSLIKQ
jgi:preprotein translocase subunit SecG